VDDSYQWNAKNGFISFAAPERDLNTVPTYPSAPFLENAADVTDIAEVKNFLYLIDSENYKTKADFIHAVVATNYDLVIMDLFHNETAYTQAEIQQLKTKKNGGRRLVICYLSIGEAEDYRYYWQTSWNAKKPEWLLRENPEWAGNYKVKYWAPEWQDIIFAGEQSYLQEILDAGFDGAYLDLIDAFEYFED
jgi:cysteinyl-tRNA synthetase